MTLFANEAALCKAFVDAATARGEWTAYPETAGFDILMSRTSDGAQVGIEAKLALNAKVIAQALPKYLSQTCAVEGPEYRAVLVPSNTRPAGLDDVCAALGITVLRMHLDDPRGWGEPFSPRLPTGQSWQDAKWHEWCPLRRSALPDYVPDVVAGASAPVALTPWKVKAIKLAILLEERAITRSDFKALQLSPSRWTDPYTGWLVRVEGGYRRGKSMPDFKAQHPRNYEEIKSDRAKWDSGATA